nr:MAG TPA: hypothetical protein [Caudoviricetes sp.]
MTAGRGGAGRLLLFGRSVRCRCHRMQLIVIIICLGPPGGVACHGAACARKTASFCIS